MMKMRSLNLRSILQFLSISFLAFNLTILSASPLLAQLTFSTPSTDTSTNPGNSIWNLNRTYSCGEAICSDVIIDGEIVLTVTSSPEAKPEDSSFLSADKRASKIQSVIKRIIHSRSG
jgi:hypothetical protein